jgi:hypothetical protein
MATKSATAAKATKTKSAGVGRGARAKGRVRGSEAPVESSAFPRAADLRGTALGIEDVRSGKVLTTSGDPNAVYAWDVGVAISRYLDGLREGTILAARCHRCDRTVVPPRAFCEKCFRPMAGLVPVKDTGTVNTFSICHVRWDAVRIETPEIPAVIDIDGTKPSVGFLHMLGEVDPRKVRTGTRVQAVWKPKSERTGAITDIRYFKPI